MLITVKRTINLIQLNVMARNVMTLIEDEELTGIRVDIVDYEDMHSLCKFSLLRLFVAYEKEVGKTFMDLDEIEDSNILILANEEEDIGFIMGTDLIGETINAMYVKPEHRGNNYGKDLIDVYCRFYGEIEKADQASDKFIDYVSNILKQRGWEK